MRATVINKPPIIMFVANESLKKYIPMQAAMNILLEERIEPLVASINLNPAVKKACPKYALKPESNI